jgi:hypothetical protein
MSSIKEEHVLKGDISAEEVLKKVGHLVSEVVGVAEEAKEHLLAEVFTRRFNQLAMNTYPQLNLLASVVSHDPREVKILHKENNLGSWKPEQPPAVPGPNLQPAPGPLVQQPVEPVAAAAAVVVEPEAEIPASVVEPEPAGDADPVAGEGDDSGEDLTHGGDADQQGEDNADQNSNGEGGEPEGDEPELTEEEKAAAEQQQ